MNVRPAVLLGAIFILKLLNPLVQLGDVHFGFYLHGVSSSLKREARHLGQRQFQKISISIGEMQSVVTLLFTIHDHILHAVPLLFMTTS